MSKKDKKVVKELRRIENKIISARITKNNTTEGVCYLEALGVKADILTRVSRDLIEQKEILKQHKKRK